MAVRSQNRKAVAWIVWVAACAAGVAVALSYPRPVSHPVLGAGWHCSRTAFLTRCIRDDHKSPVVDTSRHIDGAVLRRV